MKKKLSELTTLERHWCLAECLGEYPSKVENNKVYTWDVGFNEWNPDTNKALMWDLEKEIDKTSIKFEWVVSIYALWIHGEDPVHRKEKEEITQLAYIYHRLGNEVEVPELC